MNRTCKQRRFAVLFASRLSSALRLSQNYGCMLANSSTHVHDARIAMVETAYDAALQGG
jgi:hypothetical protein